MSECETSDTQRGDYEPTAAELQELEKWRGEHGAESDLVLELGSTAARVEVPFKSLQEVYDNAIKPRPRRPTGTPNPHSREP